jgi:hypothetical protein
VSIGTPFSDGSRLVYETAPQSRFNRTKGKIMMTIANNDETSNNQTAQFRAPETSSEQIFTTTLFAQPYNRDAQGFYFHDAEEFETKSENRACKNFCVNGHSAGNCHIARSDDDRRKESSTQGVAG